MSGELHARVKEYCDAKGISQSSLVERLLRAEVGMEQRETVRKVEVIRTVAIAPVHPTAKPANGKRRVTPKPEALAARKIQLADEAARRLDPEEVGKALGASRIVKVGPGHCPPAPESTYGMSEEERAARKVKISEADERRAGNIFTF